MHHSTQTTVMEGVLAGTVTLGVCKSTCDLLSLPSVGASLNSVCFCCGCLLIFTDLTVTAFLALLWLAEPWLPPFPVPSDVITLRFLLFLGHTYGAMLLLTVPLIATETACKLLLAPTGTTRADGGGGGGSEGRREADGAETGRARDADAGGRAEAAWRLSPVPGFLCSLLAWALCGVWGGRSYVAGQLDAEVCVLRTGSLALCLPDLAAVTRSAGGDPSLTLPAVVLLLALPVSLGTLRRGRARRPAEGAAVAKEAPYARMADECPGGPRAAPTPAAHTGAHSPCLFAQSDRGQSPSAIACGRVNGQTLSEPCQRTAAAHARPTSRRSALRARLSRALCGTRAHTSCRTPVLSLLAGLLCAAVLCLLPPSLAINPLLISSVGSLAERSLKY